MNTKLIWITPDAEKIILYCARVSSPHQDSTDTNLLSYLIRHQHWSPFEMAHMCVEITTSRAIGRQILRHPSFRFQEFSQRYAPALHVEHVNARMQATDNRQSSNEPASVELEDWWQTEIRRVQYTVHVSYVEAIQRGIAKESARFLLPEFTQTRLYMVGNMRSWIHYLRVRTQPETQQEHREVAQAIAAIFREQMPHTSAAITVNFS